MKIVHRISINSTPDIQRELAAMSVFVGKGDPVTSGLVAFDVDESHAAWPRLKEWIERRNALDVVSTKFSAAEIGKARWLELEAEWHHGYPQPNELEFGYRAVTYDLTDYCEGCGIGLRQKAPFRMKSEPKWGRRGILQLNWVFDEYFVTPEVWAGVFKPYGVAKREVLGTGGAELKTVVQLVVGQEIDIVTQGLLSENCAACDRVKYAPVARGYFPALVSEPQGHMVKTRQYFGSGASANHCVLISQDLASALASENVRGASVRPVAERSRQQAGP